MVIAVAPGTGAAALVVARRQRDRQALVSVSRPLGSVRRTSTV